MVTVSSYKKYRAQQSFARRVSSEFDLKSALVIVLSSLKAVKRLLQLRQVVKVG